MKGVSMPKSHKIIYAFYVLIWIILAINPKYPEDWLLENVLVFLLFPMIIWLDKKYSFSLTSILLLLVFSIFHSIGAHYTYAQMPYFDTITEFFGFERNHFDRLVHFLSGLLLFKPILEIITTHVGRNRAALVFTFTMIVTIATIYEIFEWFAVVIFHPDLGSAFLGTQGDVWDAQQDIFVAIIGALVNVVIFFKRYKIV
jgi:putative membrane protein